MADTSSDGKCEKEVKQRIYIGKTNFYNIKKSVKHFNTKTRNKEATRQAFCFVNSTAWLRNMVPQ